MEDVFSFQVKQLLKESSASLDQLVTEFELCIWHAHDQQSELWLAGGCSRVHVSQAFAPAHSHSDYSNIIRKREYSIKCFTNIRILIFLQIFEYYVSSEYSAPLYVHIFLASFSMPVVI